MSVHNNLIFSKMLAYHGFIFILETLHMEPSFQDDEFISVGEEFSYNVPVDEHQRKESPSNSDKKDPHGKTELISSKV